MMGDNVRKRMNTYVQPGRFALQQKLTEHYKSTRLENFKKNKDLNKKIKKKKFYKLKKKKYNLTIAKGPRERIVRIIL